MVFCYNDGTAEISDGETRKTIEKTSKEKKIIDFKFSPNSKLLIILYDDSSAALYNIEENLAFELGENPTCINNSTTFSSNSKLVSINYEDDYDVLWDTQTSQKFDGIWISSDSRLAIFQENTKTAILYNFEEKQSYCLSDGTKNIFGFRFSSDNKTINIAYNDFTVSLWDVNAKKMVTFEENTPKIKDIDTLLNSDMVVLKYKNREPSLYDLKTNRFICLGNNDKKIVNLWPSNDGLLVAIIYEDDTTVLLNRKTKEITSLNKGNNKIVGVSWLANNTLLQISYTSDAVSLWSAREKKFLIQNKTLAKTRLLPEELLALILKDGSVVLCNLITSELTCLKEPEKHIVDIQFLLKHKIILIKHSKGTIALYDLEKNNFIPLADNGKKMEHLDIVNDLLFICYEGCSASIYQINSLLKE